jgi:hypothetical protein
MCLCVCMCAVWVGEDHRRDGPCHQPVSPGAGRAALWPRGHPVRVLLHAHPARVHHDHYHRPRCGSSNGEIPCCLHSVHMARSRRGCAGGQWRSTRSSGCAAGSRPTWMPSSPPAAMGWPTSDHPRHRYRPRRPPGRRCFGPTATATRTARLARPGQAQARRRMRTVHTPAHSRAATIRAKHPTASLRHLPPSCLSSGATPVPRPAPRTASRPTQM